MIKHHFSASVKPARVVIFGAGGFVARDLTAHLSTVGIDHLAVGSSRIDLAAPDADAQIKSILRPDDVLVVTSALTPDRGKDVRTFMKNLAMASSICAAVETSQCAQVVYLSSDSVYDEQATLIRESTPRSPSNLYGMMHAAREQMLQTALARQKIPLCLVRPSAIYGAGDTHNAYGPNRFLRSAVAQRTIALFGNGEEQRDHIYIKDVSRFLELCVTRRTEGAVNLVTGTAASFRHVAECVSGIVPGQVQFEPLPRSGPITHRHFDVSERVAAFPEFQTTPLERGLEAMHREITQQNETSERGGSSGSPS